MRAGAGETAPGRLALKLAPSLPGAIASNLEHGCIVVSGTNGKTTTTSLLVAIAEANGWKVATSRSGSNLARGVTGALVTQRRADAGIFEVDEAALPGVVRMVNPHALVLTNIFRDQLDRFGEPERVRELFREAVVALPAGAHVIVNAHDPALSSFVPPARTFAIVAEGRATEFGGEPETCPRCGATLRAERRTFAHLGVFSCAACTWRSPDADTLVEVRAREGVTSLRLAIGGDEITTNIGGLYNAYNVAAAIAAADALGFDRARTLSVVAAFRARYGRQEELRVDGTRALVMLAKNPAGADAVIGELGNARTGAVVLAVNDLIADGRDVSWIWDIDLEPLRALGVPVVASGARAEEVALRLKYAGVTAAACEPDPAAAARTAAALSGDDDVAIIATYTSMLGLRRALIGSGGAHVLDA